MPLSRYIRRMPIAPAALILVSLLAASVMTRSNTQVARAEPPSTLTRIEDPVVMSGADLPALGGHAPGNIVAFRYSGAWQQIPVQVDERVWRSFRAIYNNITPFPLSMNVTPSQLVYADPGTHTGADTDATFDADDELVFMAKDAGGQPPPFSTPGGVVAASGIEVEITNPLQPSETGWVYLFRQDGSLAQGAGEQYVNYSFSLLSGPYLTTYKHANYPGPNAGNPENSTVTTPYYGRHFGDRWQDDALSITAGAASNADILDRHKALYAPGNCGRSENTFDFGDTNGFPGEGAFVANRVGPIRAIRSYIGANSGPNTQRDHVYYQQREDIRTYLRVHPIGSIMDFWDLSPDAALMTYYDDLNTGGALVDGNPETLASGETEWQMVTGAQGSLMIAGTISTDIPAFSYTSYYLDDTTPPVTQCTGDAVSYGAGGVFFDPPGDILCTDPGRNFNCPQSGPLYFLHSVHNLYFDAPGMDVADAQALAARSAAPLAFAPAPWQNAAANTDADSLNDAADNCPAVTNAGQQNNDRNFIDLPPSKAYDDLTRPMSDTVGDACDADDDNDGISDALELAGPCASATGATNPLSSDSDGDRVLDGAECALNTNPLSAANFPSSIQCGSTIDSDGDGILDFREFCYYGTSVTSANSDGDNCRDGQEIASINGDLAINVVDLQQIAQSMGHSTSPQYIPNMDITKNGSIDVADLQQAAQQQGFCSP